MDFDQVIDSKTFTIYSGEEVIVCDILNPHQAKVFLGPMQIAFPIAHLRMLSIEECRITENNTKRDDGWKYFGQPLSTTTELDEEPWLLKKLIDSLMSEYIDGKISDYALYEIYQPDAAKEKIASLVEKIEGEGRSVSFSGIDSKIVFSVLRLYLASLPEPLVPLRYFAILVHLTKIKSISTRYDQLRTFVSILPPLPRKSLSLLIQCLQTLVYSLDGDPLPLLSRFAIHALGHGEKTLASNKVAAQPEFLTVGTRKMRNPRFQRTLVIELANLFTEMVFQAGYIILQEEEPLTGSELNSPVQDDESCVFHVIYGRAHNDYIKETPNPTEQLKVVTGGVHYLLKPANSEWVWTMVNEQIVQVPSNIFTPIYKIHFDDNDIAEEKSRSMLGVEFRGKNLTSFGEHFHQIGYKNEEIRKAIDMLLVTHTPESLTFEILAAQLFSNREELRSDSML
eukprot:TRINITY_DN1068_c0_g1_i3.p1 TRINITY_DN1068_c0_g1~~TRINITY_DN1068_c0_g1_i3.p1  ORF type:complete len:453 (+),score=103.29 TRINITY_DN1068_c0_g1_i3:872-2230(+)